MDLIDDPPHTGSLYGASRTDGELASKVTYSLKQSGIPCSINPLSSNEKAELGRMSIIATHCVGIVTSSLTVTPTRGDKFVNSAGVAFHVTGIRRGEAYDDCPELTYLDVEAKDANV